jgi:hypothetical protein
MEVKKKVVALLLVLAIMFSIISISINLFAANITMPNVKKTDQIVSGSSRVKIIVEGNNFGVVK